MSQIITFGTMAAKAVVRDVARVQGKSYGLADRLSKMIPFEVGMTLEKPTSMEEICATSSRSTKKPPKIWEMALKARRRCRVPVNTPVVGDRADQTDRLLADYCDEEGGGLVTQFDKDDVEAPAW